MKQNITKRKIIIAITGASGAIYGKQLLDDLYKIQGNIESAAVIFSKNGIDVWKYEIGDLPKLNAPFTIYEPDDFFSPIASGSSGYDTMIICPCSMGTLGRIANGISGDLISRAADIMLKERRRIILVQRETPYSLIHINNMKLLTEAGAIICPASPSFYSKPESIEELVKTVTDRVLSLAGFDIAGFKWGEK